ncbi:DUF2802 domain-containing protein [Pseudoalteromonas sp.]|uniref:DUF2802 domain-containing protein n=1 Tax=Pseudoalteromonas sp. TaxID=53249 RepID=UPI003562E0D5
MIWQIISIAALCVAICACIIAFSALLRLKRVQKIHKDSESQLVKQQIINKNEIEEIRSGLLKIGKHVMELQSEAQELKQKQQDIQLADPESKIYSRAVKMIDLGADIEEVMRECELPRAEAELLFTLHQKEG